MLVLCALQMKGFDISAKEGSFELDLIPYVSISYSFGFDTLLVITYHMKWE